MQKDARKSIFLFCVFDLDEDQKKYTIEILREEAIVKMG